MSVVVTDISPQTDASNLFAVLDVFAENGLSITCAARPPHGGLDGYTGILEDLIRRRPDLDIALEIPDLAELSPYFQARAVFEARRKLGALGVGEPSVALRSVLCDPVAAPTAPTGVRSAGIRNVLVRPERDEAVRSETWPNGVVRFYGGAALTPWSAAVPFLEGETHGLFYISAKTLAGGSAAGLRRWASTLAAGFFDAELAGRAVALPVSDLQLRDHFQFARLVAIRLVGGGAASGRLAQNLEELGIPVLVEPDVGAGGYWVPEPESGQTGVIALDTVACLPGEGLAISAPAALDGGTVLIPVEDTGRAVGLDACAALALRNIRLTQPVRAGEPLPAVPGQGDFLLTIEPGALESPIEENAMLAALRALGEDGVTRFVTLDGLANALLSHDPIERRFRRTRAARLDAMPDPPVLQDEAAAYMEDAQRAWRYFEEFTDANTGLCPATVNVRTGEGAINWLTMWDVGSQINALVAAHQLGLIGTDQYNGSARRILFQIAGRPSQGRLLPNGVIRTDRVRSGSSDFDGCDAGRLLAALDNLRRHSELGVEIAELVASWDLDQIIVDQAIHSVRDGALLSTYSSHCAHYSVLAFARWGLTAMSPYQTSEGRSPADGEMALLEAVSRIGPFGAEPLLLEAMELGMSPESAFLADVLHVAQVEEYEETGTLTAVSEMPISRPPWFIYLGLQLGRETREWGVDAVDGEAEYQTPAFLDETMALSSKAAYLWSAYRPGAYADRLVSVIRDKARLPIGFASNVNEAKGGVPAPFTDLNTNAVILQAIAHKLGH